nr:E3 ubiquitin-protein ligase RNF14 [Ipomoea batatas]GMD66739.1 E3 ubiquitin-protein ligase RNF14 [Ipomoea batatas]
MAFAEAISSASPHRLLCRFSACAEVSVPWQGLLLGGRSVLGGMVLMKLKRVPALAACLTKCGGEEDHRVEGGGGVEVRVPSDCGEETSGTKEKEENGGVGVGVEEFDDVGRRLEELRLGVEEAELSEEQLRINDQAQEDEVTMLGVVKSQFKIVRILRTLSFLL